MNFENASDTGRPNIDNSPDQHKKRSRFRNLIRRKRMKTRSPSVGYVASNLKASCSNDPDMNQEESLLYWPILCTFTLTLLFTTLCLRLSPQTMLKGALLIEFFFCSLPIPLANWMMVLLLLLQMDLLIQFELVIGIAMLDWLNRLDWAFAWYRLDAWLSPVQAPQAHTAQLNGSSNDDGSSSHSRDLVA